MLAQQALDKRIGEEKQQAAVGPAGDQLLAHQAVAGLNEQKLPVVDEHGALGRNQFLGVFQQKAKHVLRELNPVVAAGRLDTVVHHQGLGGGDGKAEVGGEGLAKHGRENNA